ncbi:lactadherin-like isoform X1 [Haliotis rubra]|uniref:lactadherin-like isoform X1 n=1 Tax=Haliotis rubra TaxID=36100 RepID=UPI001EE59865|nr:lactadherin-like isoform X1 [Haliotis rubra]XP_046567294.1 lactadherin-like isoform X1 [Haliotis rubra]XP_046567295.1 lactadherin-like isoform X1 [Haliotis rubra]
MNNTSLYVFWLLTIFCGIALASVCTTNGPLGMITGTIKDWQISASSVYPQEWDRGCNEKYARVYLPNKLGWCAKYKSSSEWLQVDMGVAARVTGVMTQGRGDGLEWVTSFMVSFSMDAFHWNYVTDNYGNQRIFEGNTDSFSVKHSYLDKPIIARFVKFHTVHWHRHPSMRVEIMGCQLCKESIGLPPYGKITSSSSRKFRKKSSCQPEDGNIFSKKAWCAKQQNDKQWIQLDVGPPTLVTGVITKGRGDTKRSHWVERFKVSYSNDTTVWYFYKDADHLDPKSRWLWSPPSNTSTSHLIPDKYSEEGLLFGGNSDKNTDRTHFLNSPFVSRFVRFHPMEWHGKISMRVGLLGCPYTGVCSSGFMRINDDTPCVENLAFKKESWINSKRHYKRHIRNQVAEGHASRAVDGNLDINFQSCTILDNLYGDNPVWTVDLGNKQAVAGVIIYTWQGRKALEKRIASGDPLFTNHKGERQEGTSFQEYMKNLDKLVVYVDEKLKDEDDSYASGNMCNYVSSLNNALFEKKLILQCIRRHIGRYVLIEAWGVPNSWSRLFSAVLCEVQVFS